LSRVDTPAPLPDAGVIACPYKGLTYYTEQDAQFFFGRERERQVITANLTASRLTILYGESGVGKSSLLRAGVAHRLSGRAARRLAEDRPPEFVPVVFSAWRDDPVAGLRAAVRDAIEPYTADGPLLDDSVDDLRRILALGADGVRGTLLLILDQFEDYFLYHARSAEDVFADAFPRAVKDTSLRVHFLIGIREDAYAQLDQFKGKIPNLFDNYLRIQHLTRDAAQSAVEKPIEELNRQNENETRPIEIEPALVEAVLDQVRAGVVVLGPAGEGKVETNGASRSEQRIEAPYLQLVLEKLWFEEMRQKSRVLRLETLERLGGADRIVKQHVDSALATLSDGERDLAANVFRQLVTRGGTKIAHTASDLADFAEVKPDRLTPLLEKLSAEPARILRPVAAPPDQSDGLRYEIYHDVLGPAILDWRTRQTLRAKEDEARRERARARKFRTVALVAGVLALVASALAVLAWDQQRTARSKRLAAEAIALMAVDPAASVGLASEALDVKDTKEAEDTLRRALSASHLRLVLSGHRDWVTDASFSPDGTRVVTASEDGTARVWRAASGRTLQVLRHGDRVNIASFSPDGTYVATGADDRLARVWDSRTGREVARLRTGDDVLSTVFTADSGTVLVGGADGAIRLWRWRDGTQSVITRLRRAGRRSGGSPPGSAVGVERVVLVRAAPSPLLLVVADDGTVRMLTSSGKEIGRITGQGEVTSAAIDPSSSRVLIGLANGTAQMWTFSRKGIGSPFTFRSLLGGHAGPVTDVAFSPDGHVGLTAGEDGSVKIWEPSLERVLLELHGHSDAVTSAQFRPSGGEIVTSSADGTARIWAWPDPGTVELRGHGYAVNAAHFSRDGRRVVTAGATEPQHPAQVILWSARGTKEFALSKNDWYGVADAAFDKAGDKIVIATRSGQVQVYDSRSPGPPLLTRKISDVELTSVAVSPDGQTIATTAADKTAALWRWMQEGARPQRWQAHTDWVYDAAFSPDGKYLATTSADRLARVWSLRAPRPILVKQLAGHRGAVNTAQFDPIDSSRLLTASADGTAKVWDWRSGRVLLTIADETQLTSAAFNRSGTRILTTGADGITRVWNAANGRILAVLRRHANRVRSGEFSPDGSLILTASDDWTAKLYPCVTCGGLASLREQAKRWESYAHTRGK
jgi:WD40 repeat protein